MIIPKKDIPEDTVHYIIDDAKIVIPDYLIDFKKFDEGIEEVFYNVDCILSYHFLTKINEVVLKPVAIRFYEKVTYRELYKDENEPNFVYIFSKGTLNIEDVKTRIFSE